MEQDHHVATQLKTVTDGSGNNLELEVYKGHFFPRVGPFDAVKKLPKLPTFQFRDDDITLMAYPKSGTHWVWEMVHMIRMQSVEERPETKENTFIEMRGVEAVENRPPPRVLNSHMQPMFFPTLWESRCKIIYIYRNPKDVAVSWYYHTRGITGYAGSFDDYLGLFLEGQVWFDKWSHHLLTWQEQWQKRSDRFLLVSYEDLQLDPAGQIQRIADFVGIPTSPELCREIVEKCSFGNMESKNEKEPNKDAWNDGKPKMFRKGIVGDWKNHFTVARSEQFDAVMQEDLEKIKLEMRFSV